MAKRVYKFTSTPYGISNLQNKRLKLSTIDDLNDPFDLTPIDTTGPAISNAIDELVRHLRKKLGILCFSRNWKNLLLWSHYGASHAGICLGFDIAENEPGVNYNSDVLYQPSMLQIQDPQDVNLDLASRLLRTKHESWSYEQEVRMFVGLSEPPDANSLNWIGFGPQLELKEVIVGSQCHPMLSKDVEEAVRAYGEGVKCRWAGMRRDAFLLVKLDHPPDWHETVR